MLWLPEAYEQLLRELVLHLPLEDWLEPARWTAVARTRHGAPGSGEIAAGLLAVNGGGERSQVELAPADHYGVVWTPEFKSRLRVFSQGRVTNCAPPRKSPAARESRGNEAE